MTRKITVIFSLSHSIRSIQQTDTKRVEQNEDKSSKQLPIGYPLSDGGKDGMYGKQFVHIKQLQQYSSYFRKKYCMKK